MDKTEQPKSTPVSVKPEFVVAQIEQAMETFRTQYSLIVQGLTVLVIANVTVVGFAISTQIAGIMLIGALFPMLMLTLMYRGNRIMIPIVYTAIGLEQNYGGVGSDWLASTLVSVTTSREFVDKLRAISTIQDQAERMSQLDALKTPLVLAGGRGITRVVLVLSATGQIILPIILSLVFQWRFL